MCGIVGHWALNQPDEPSAALAIVRAMASTLVHRGPDGQGDWLEPSVHLAFGFRRLAIQDLSPAGDQPMQSADGRYVIVFNGEIYNFREMRASFSGDTNWHGGSDTEVLLETIARDGLDAALDAADGMYAFALWDRQLQQLTLARDRTGEKPLYYGWVGDRFAFASELKALKRLPNWRGKINQEAVAAMLRYAYVPTPHSIFEGIGKLPPGAYLQLGVGDIVPGRMPSPVRYWEADAELQAAAGDPFTGSDDDALAVLEALLATSVERRMIADVPVGGYLSGGIDSASVAAIMQKVSTGPVRTFTIGFNDPKYDESPQAAAVAKHLGTDHTAVAVADTDVLDLVSRMPTVFDEPFADVSQLPTMLLAQVAKRHVTTVLTGDGGDELFAGYPRYGRVLETYDPVAGLSKDAPRPRRELEKLSMSLNAIGGGLRRPPRLGDKLYRWWETRGARSLADVHEKYMSRWRTAQRPVDTPVPDWFPTLTAAAIDPLTASTFLDYQSYLPDDLLVKVDRTTMAVSLESRIPLLNHEIIRFAWRLPAHMKVRGGTSKWLLRQLLYKYVPQELVDRPKQGFEPPVGAWLRGPLRDWAEPLLDAAALENNGLNADVVHKVWREHQDGARDWRFELWNVLMYQAWRQEHKAQIVN